jgi:tetratricopeptide (TPR) repeat protein
MATSTSSGSGDYELFDELAEEFAGRYRRGERPSLQEYVDRCPEMVDEIRELFPALLEVEQAEEVLGPRHELAARSIAPAFRQVGDYRVIREVGRGGMGVVFEAEQVSLGRRVALKILPGAIATDGKALERFRREARAAARLHHTNIVPVFEVGQDGDVVFYAMQFILGQGLEVVIDELARQRQHSRQESAPPLKPAPAASSPPVRPDTIRTERTGAAPGRSASLLVRERTEGMAASPQALRVSHIARSLLTGTFAAEIAGPQQPGSSNGLTATDDRAIGASDRSPSGPDSPVSFAPSPTSAVLPGGTQVSTVESSGRRLPFFRSVAQIGRQVAQGLAYAHARGIIHRDIKPSNLLLDSAGVVWITDFGLAKAEDEGLTATGDILGTLRYMAPERFRGEGDARADVYALGLTLYELLTLRPGFESTDRLRMIERIKAEDPARPRTLDGRVPRDLETIVLKAIDKDPGRRYPTADAMAEDLRRYLDDEPVLARRTTALERCARWARHNPGVAFLGGLLTAVLLLVTVGSLIAAGSMKRLAAKEAKAARTAELNATEADAQRQQAEANFAKARSAVDESFTKISESQLLAVPGMQPLRRELLSSALGFYEGFVQEHGDDPTVRAGLASAFLRLGKIHRELSELQAATESFQKARELFEPLVQANPAGPELSDALAESLNGLGRYDEAIAIWQRLVVPGQTRFHREIAGAYFSMARAEQLNWNKRLDSFQKSLSIREMLVTLSPNDPVARRDLGSSLNNIADSLEQLRQNEQSLALYRRTLTQVEMAFAPAPHDWKTGRAVSLALWNCANMEYHFGSVDEAWKLHRRRIEFSQNIAMDNPFVPLLQSDVIGLHGYSAFLIHLREQGLHDEAFATIRRAQEWIERFPRRGAEGMFDLACARAVCSSWFNPGVRPQTTEEREEQTREADLAVKTLSQAVAAGFVDLERFDADHQLDPLRSLPDFQAVASRLRSKTSRGTSIGSSSATRGPSTGRPPDHGTSGSVASAQSQENQAAARHAIGLALFQLGKLDAAAQNLAEALEIRQQLVAKGHARLDYRLELAATLVGLVELDQKAGRSERAKDWSRQALPILTSVVEDRPTDRPAWDLLLNLGKLDAAAADFLRALPVENEPAPEQHADTERRAELAGIHLSIGKALIDLGRVDSAIARLEAARDFYDVSGDLSREKARFRAERVATFMALGRAYSQSGRRGDSEMAWDRAGNELTQAIEERPDVSQLWINRARFYMQRRQESLAAADLGQACNLYPGWDWSRPILWASLVLFNGDKEEYRRGCRLLLERFGQTRNANFRAYLAITLGLGEDAVDDYSHVVRITEEATNEIDFAAPKIYHDLALVCLRAGRYEAALRALDNLDHLLPDWPARTLNDPVRAIVCHRLGRHAEARAALQKAREWAEHNEKNGPPDVPDLDLIGEWYRHLVLLREAEALIVYDPIFPADPFAR